uniref:SAP domain-containing protein n=1 Tax=viral metagenome TaxID=1070528 RepID=A0A6M3MDK2_9ZZZZ
MVIRGPKYIAPEKMQQLLVAGKEQLSEEEYSRLKSLLIDLQLYGLSAYLNSEIGKIMSGISWELAISESPEWEEALIACDAAFLGRELKDMCLYAGLSPQGHKKELCARLYEAEVPEVVEIMKPFLEEEEVEHLPQTEPLYRSPLGEVKERLEELRRTAPEEFYRRKRIIEGGIQERLLKRWVRTMKQYSLQELQEILDSAERLHR